MYEPLLLDRLLQVVDLFQRDMARAFVGTELTASRMGVLWVLHHDGPLPQQRLADALSVSARHVSGLVDALEAAGHVRRTPHPTDRRIHLVELTSRGAELMTRTAGEHADIDRRLLDAVAPEDRAALRRGLDAVVTRLSAMIAEAER